MVITLSRSRMQRAYFLSFNILPILEKIQICISTGVHYLKSESVRDANFAVIDDEVRMLTTLGFHC